MNKMIKTPISWCLSMLALTTAPALQAEWKADGTDIVENGPLAFATAQANIPVLYSDKPNATKVKVNVPPTPKSTREWKMVGLSTCVIGGVKADITGVAMVPYPEKYEAKQIKGIATYKATPTKENEYSTADAHPVSTTNDTRTLTRSR